MRQKLILLPMLAAIIIVIWSQCANTNSQNIAAAVPMTALTHQEAIDSLRIDTSEALKPIKYTKLNDDDILIYLNSVNFAQVLQKDYPDNGFYGENYYRIEFILTDVKKDEIDPMVYHIKGKNRHKNVITDFDGWLKVDNITKFEDPNIDTSEIANIGYNVKASYELKEDPSLPTSGTFAGTMKMDIYTNEEGKLDLWYYSDDIESGGAGYRFDGTWTSYAKGTVKQVIWASDLFSFANDILKDFSIGEREVEINPKYRNLGWEEIYTNEEWWHDNNNNDVATSKELK